MADSKRQQIMTAIDARLKTILIAGGYETNLGNNVYEFWEIALEETELPGAIWRDGEESSELLVTSKQDRTMIVHLLFQAAGADAPKQLRKCLADAEKSLTVGMVGGAQTWGGLAIETGPLEITESFEMEHAERRIGAARTKFSVQYRTGFLDPYA